MRARTAAVRYVRDKSAPNEASSHSAHFDRFLHQHRVLAEVGALAERAANDLVVHNHVDLFSLAEGRTATDAAATTSPSAMMNISSPKKPRLYTYCPFTTANAVLTSQSTKREQHNLV